MDNYVISKKQISEKLIQSDHNPQGFKLFS